MYVLLMLALLLGFFIFVGIIERERSLTEWMKAYWFPAILLLLTFLVALFDTPVKNEQVTLEQPEHKVSAYVMGFSKGRAEICYMVDTVRYVDMISVSPAEWAYFFFDAYGTMRKPKPTERDGTGTDVTHIDILLCPEGDSLYLEFNGYRKVTRYMNKHLKHHFGGLK